MDEEQGIPVDPDGDLLVELALRNAEWDAPPIQDHDRIEYPDDDAPPISGIEAAMARGRSHPR